MKAVSFWILRTDAKSQLEIGGHMKSQISDLLEMIDELQGKLDPEFSKDPSNRRFFSKTEKV